LHHRILVVHPPRLDVPVPGQHLTAADVDAAADLVWTEPEITDVAWFWRTDPGSSGLDRMREESEYNFSALLQMIQEMEDLGRSQPLRIWLVTVGGQWLDGDERYGVGADALAAGSLWGFGRVMANEYPAYRVTLVDLQPGDVVNLQPLLDEVCCADSGVDDFQLAFRGAMRYLLRLLPVQTPVGRATDGELVSGDDGLKMTYLITGGLGGLGLVAARKLVDAGARHLTLVSRRVAADETVAALQAQLGEEVRLRGRACRRRARRRADRQPGLGRLREGALGEDVRQLVAARGDG
jgi:NAD(P)-dependent dehydrogenase (short-subunit alcohol dehydrogenase family)